MIEQRPNKPWKWKYISKNPNLTMEYIITHIYKDWDWDAISENRTINMGMIDKCHDQISWFYLSKNNFDWTGKNIRTLVYYSIRKKQTIEQTKVFKDELMGITWHPDRFMEWCVDIGELRKTLEMFGK